MKIENLRILGVLQRIGICFALASLLLHYVGKKGGNNLFNRRIIFILVFNGAFW